MVSKWAVRSVIDLQKSGILRVEDGNHGESRPRPAEFVDQGGVAFIRASDMANGLVDFIGSDHINEVALARITKGIGQPGDILFSHKGTVGKLALTGLDAPPFVCSPQTTFWRTTDEEQLDRRFLYAFMRSRLFRAQWHARKGETDMADYVSLTAQRTFQVPLPGIDEQRAIGDALDPFEDAIINCRTYASSLHTLAEKLFRSLFVDLDLIKENKGNNPELLLEEISSLMPTTYSETEIGYLPGGWRVESLDRVARFKNGIAMQKFPPKDGNSLPVLKIAQLRDGTLEGADRATNDLPEDVVVDNGDVVFSWSGTLIVRIWCGGRAALNQHLFKVTSLEFPRWFFYFWTRVHLPEFQAVAADKKTTMGHIKRHHLSDAKVLVPDTALLEKAQRIFEPMIERLVLCELQARRLESLRDALLRAFMTGEAQVMTTGSPRGETVTL